MSDEMFDPTEGDYSGGSSSNGDFKDLKTEGTYLLGVRKCIKHGLTASDNPKRYSRFAFVVIDGPQAGASFTDRIFRDPSAYKRLGYMCKAMRITDKFNPSKDPEMERVFVGRTLRSSVKINENNYAELKYPESEQSEDELALMKAWEVTFKRAVKKALDRQSLGDSAEDFGGGAGDFDKAPLDFDDSDIPF